MNAISPDEFKQGYLAFQQRERRDAMYTTASFLVKHYWGNPTKMAEGLGVLVLHWNQAFYRYGPFDYDRLEQCISDNAAELESYRNRDISTYQPTADDSGIKSLFQAFLGALAICEGNVKGRSSPVAVAKAMHLLAPAFFPLWDEKIAKAYDCYYDVNPADKYINFMRKTKEIAAALASCIQIIDDKTLLKLIDEYNYAKHTKQWV